MTEEEAKSDSFMTVPLVYSEDQRLSAKIPVKYDALTQTQIYAYGVGHFANDIIAGVLFNYGVYYLITVMPINSDPRSAASIVGYQGFSQLFLFIFNQAHLPYRAGR